MTVFDDCSSTDWASCGTNSSRVHRTFRINVIKTILFFEYSFTFIWRHAFDPIYARVPSVCPSYDVEKQLDKSNIPGKYSVLATIALAKLR